MLVVPEGDRGDYKALRGVRRLVHSQLHERDREVHPGMLLEKLSHCFSTLRDPIADDQQQESRLIEWFRLLRRAKYMIV
jgi:hypothetical protein